MGRLLATAWWPRPTNPRPAAGSTPANRGSRLSSGAELGGPEARLRGPGEVSEGPTQHWRVAKPRAFPEVVIANLVAEVRCGCLAWDLPWVGRGGGAPPRVAEAGYWRE